MKLSTFGQAQGVFAGSVYALLLALILGCAGCQDRPVVAESLFVIPPYVQNPGQTEMTIMWATVQPVEATMCYGTGGVPDRQKVVASQPAARMQDDTGNCIYKVRLTGLTPSTKYRYLLVAGDARTESTFRTWPEKDELFTFVAYGDSRTGHEVHRQIGQAIKAHDPAFIVHTGDLVSSGAVQEWKPHFFDPLQGVIDHIPLLACCGNHEGSGSSFLRMLEMPSSEFWYSFDYCNAHFVALDCCDLAKPNGQKMLAWLAQDLATSRAAKAEWKIVFYHYPTYDVSRHGDWGREEIAPLLRKHHVDLVLMGHSHSYQRLKPMFTKGENERHPITYMVSAGGGASLDRTVEYGPYVACSARAYNYSLIAIDGRKLSLRTFTPEGKQIDAFEITKQADGTPNAAYLAEALPEEDFETVRDAIFQTLTGITVNEAPQPGHPASVSCRVGAGPYPMKFKLRLNGGGHYVMKPAMVEGESAANGTVPATVTISAKGQTEVSGSGVLSPKVQFLCEYEINGQKGSVFGGSIRCPPANTTRSPPADVDY